MRRASVHALAGGEGAASTPDELADTEDTWGELFAERGARYEPPRLVLFTDLVRSACGMGQSAMGPFYCPADAKVYIDLGFAPRSQQPPGASRYASSR